jgi:hypothetical protein
MFVYACTNDFTLLPAGVSIVAGQSVTKWENLVLSSIDGVEVDTPAFYDWIGSSDSLNYLSFSGVVPDPNPAGSGVPQSPVAVPATPTSPGSQGTWAWDGTYVYWCISLNTWVRSVAVTSW